MEVLELPKPVINFMRSISKEMHRYTLSWDMNGSSDSVSLTLTWKLNCDIRNDDQTRRSRKLHEESLEEFIQSSSTTATTQYSSSDSENFQGNDKSNLQYVGLQHSQKVFPSNTKTSKLKPSKLKKQQMQHSKLDSLGDDFLIKKSSHEVPMGFYKSKDMMSSSSSPSRVNNNCNDQHIKSNIYYKRRNLSTESLNNNEIRMKNYHQMNENHHDNRHKSRSLNRGKSLEEQRFNNINCHQNCPCCEKYTKNLEDLNAVLKYGSLKFDHQRSMQKKSHNPISNNSNVHYQPRVQFFNSGLKNKPDEILEKSHSNYTIQRELFSNLSNENLINSSDDLSNNSDTLSENGQISDEELMRSGAKIIDIKKQSIIDPSPWVKRIAQADTITNKYSHDKPENIVNNQSKRASYYDFNNPNNQDSDYIQNLNYTANPSRMNNNKNNRASGQSQVKFC